jgi:hypothetical protein
MEQSQPELCSIFHIYWRAIAGRLPRSTLNFSHRRLRQRRDVVKLCGVLKCARRAPTPQLWSVTCWSASAR